MLRLELESSSGTTIEVERETNYRNGSARYKCITCKRRMLLIPKRLISDIFYSEVVSLVENSKELWRLFDAWFRILRVECAQINNPATPEVGDKPNPIRSSILGSRSSD